MSHVGSQSLIMRSYSTNYVFSCTENDAQDWYDALSVLIMKSNEAVANVRPSTASQTSGSHDT